MKKITLLILVLVLILASMPLPAARAAPGWKEGATLSPNWNGEFASDSFKQSLRNLVATHANYVTLVIPLYQSNLYTTDIQAGGNTPTDDALVAGITYAHSIGLKVMLKPHLESFTGEWRANINPSDRNTWFTNYGNFMVHYAQIAQQFGVEDFCVGTELIDMSSPSINSTNTQNWVNLISRVRGVYSGRLTYSANWGGPGWTDEKNNIQFWNNLDYIGISAYFNLSGDNSVQNLENQWASINSSDVQPLSQRWNKPVVFTEVGYRSISNAHTQPWDYNLSGSYDPPEQANDYQALFDFWSRQSFMQGVELWNWSSDPNAGGSGNTDYTPQNKPAQTTMTNYFSGSGAPSGPIGGAANFTASASANSTQITPGQATNLTATVNNAGSAQGGIVVDLEVYNSGNNQQVYQKFYDNQNFTQGQSQTYQTSWTPSTTGNYRVKLGVFNYNWTQNYLWVDDALDLSSNGSPSPPPPPGGSQTINIWWPTNGSTVSGVQPFKAMVTNLDISQYNMYWQVDNGGLVQMDNSATDYPHKEMLVDLSGWTWKGSGPYAINFVAKDLSGNVLVQQAVNIYITH